jgi:hypothetical protein
MATKRRNEVIVLLDERRRVEPEAVPFAVYLI